LHRGIGDQIWQRKKQGNYKIEHGLQKEKSIEKVLEQKVLAKQYSKKSSKEIQKALQKV
jgi:hypothetical protein